MREIFIEQIDRRGLLLTLIALLFVSVGLLKIDAYWSVIPVIAGVFIIVAYLLKLPFLKVFYRLQSRDVCIRLINRSVISLRLSDVKSFRVVSNYIILDTTSHGYYVINKKTMSKSKLKQLELLLIHYLINNTNETSVVTNTINSLINSDTPKVMRQQCL